MDDTVHFELGTDAGFLDSASCDRQESSMTSPLSVNERCNTSGISHTTSSHTKRTLDMYLRHQCRTPCIFKFPRSLAHGVCELRQDMIHWPSESVGPSVQGFFDAALWLHHFATVLRWAHVSHRCCDDHSESFFPPVSNKTRADPFLIY